MKCEIINPSDGCEISGDNKEALALACMLLGGGKYALQNEAGETICPLMLFGGGEEWYKKEFGRTADEGIRNLKPEVANVLKTFKYHGKRSSMNNIGARAKDLVKNLEVIGSQTHKGERDE